MMKKTYKVLNEIGEIKINISSDEKLNSCDYTKKQEINALLSEYMNLDFQITRFSDYRMEAYYYYCNDNLLSKMREKLRAKGFKNITHFQN